MGVIDTEDSQEFQRLLQFAKRPDIAIIDKPAKLISLVDVSIPIEKTVDDNEDEKMSKCKNLRI